MNILKLIFFAIKSYGASVTFMLMDPVMLIIPIVVFSRYKNIVRAQNDIYGNNVRYSLGNLISTSILSGILAGLFCAILTTTLGITFQSSNGIFFVILLSLILMSINSRYICLSYSGGILSLIILVISSLIERGFIAEGSRFEQFFREYVYFDVTSLMAVIAIFHIVEAILMWFDGHRGAIPVYMKHKGEVVGAFIMQRFWVIPVLLCVLYSGPSVPGETLPTPDWWPLIKPDGLEAIAKDAIFTTFTVLAILGYGDFSITMPVRKKVKRSALGLLQFSILLLIFAFLSEKYYIFKYIAAIFSPLGHETLILLERFREKKGKALFRYSDEGIIVLDTIPERAAEKMGISSGDLIVEINNSRVKSIEDIDEILSFSPSFVWIKVKDSLGNEKVLEYKDYENGVRALGFLTVPKNDFGIHIVEP